MAQTIKLENDGERMIPEYHKGTIIYAEHMTRYLAAQDLVAGKVVLDIASGSGYGSQLLSHTASKVYGVDVNSDSVIYAQANYSRANIEYKVGDGVSIPLEDNSVDVVVTFETIEHIEDYQTFIDEVRRVLKPDGLAVVSTPNDLEFAEGNHFHVHEFEYNELKTALAKDFANIDSYFQGTWKYAAIGDESLVTTEFTGSINTHNFAPLTREKCLYFYLICSNREITEKIKPLAATGEHYSDRTLAADYQKTQKLLQERMTVIEELRAQTAERMTVIEENGQEIDILRSTNAQLLQDIQNIRTSTTFKVASKAASLKNKLVRPHNQE